MSYIIPMIIQTMMDNVARRVSPERVAEWYARKSETVGEYLCQTIGDCRADRSPDR